MIFIKTYKLKIISICLGFRREECRRFLLGCRTNPPPRDTSNQNNIQAETYYLIATAKYK